MRVAQVLACFREAETLGISELAQLLNEHKSVVHRTLSTLESCGFLEQLPENRRYRLGLALLEYGTLVAERLEVRTVGRPVLAQLARQTGETALLTVFSGDECLCVDKCDAEQPVKIALQVGHRTPLHAGASAKAILAHLPADEIRQLLDRTVLRAYTQNTLTQREQLQEELDTIARQGYAVGRGEMDAVLRSVAAPVFNHEVRVIGSVGIAGLRDRFGPTRLPFLAEQVMAAAGAISARLGYRQASQPGRETGRQTT